MMISRMSMSGNTTGSSSGRLPRFRALAFLFLVLFASVPSSVKGQSTSPPTANTTEAVAIDSPQACDSLKPGDILIFVVETNGPLGTKVGFLALAPLLPGLELHMTDFPWNGTHFVTPTGIKSENDIQLTVGSEGIQPLERFGFGNFSFWELEWSEEWTNSLNETADGLLDLNHTQGDSLFLYCYLPDGTIRHLVGWSNAGSWAQPGLSPEAYRESLSALPSDLQELGSVVLPHKDNYVYVGSNEGTKQQLQNFMINASNWNGTDESFFEVQTYEVVLENTSTLEIVTNPDALSDILQQADVTPPPVPVRPATEAPVAASSTTTITTTTTTTSGSTTRGSDVLSSVATFLIASGGCYLWLWL